MAETTGPLSMIKKAYHQLYHLTSSFEEVLLNDQMWVSFTLNPFSRSTLNAILA